MQSIIPIIKANKILIPGLTGSVIGTLYGAYEGHKKSKHEDISVNIGYVSFYSLMGFSCGYTFGYIWPISVPILLGRAFDRGKFDSSLLFEIENKPKTSS